MAHREKHRINRIGWLRAVVLGANDGILSTASLLVGVAASEVGKEPVLIAGMAGMVAGAMSMAAGEYVSVSSQADTEAADLNTERDELAREPVSELEELTAIYQARGLERRLAEQVAGSLTANDPLEAHARDELGISSVVEAHPIQAALASAAAFGSGAALPWLAAWLSPMGALGAVVSAVSLGALALLGAVGARLGGACLWRGALRVAFWGALAMGLTWLIGRWFGGVV